MSFTLWLTGLPCAGKSTIGEPVARRLGAQWLDGDVIRHTYISRDVGFSPDDRRKHLLRIAEMCKILNDNEVPVVACFVSPYDDVRREIKSIIGGERFHLVYVDCSADICQARDVKGMWAKAIEGEIHGFTGYDAPYEVPKNPPADLCIITSTCSVDEAVNCVAVYYEEYLRNPKGRHCVYIGRWSPFHNGHYAIIQAKLAEGKKVLILVRDTPVTPEDPWSAAQRREMLESVFANNPSVNVRIIPDVESVVIGRAVGYDMEEMKVPADIEVISGTKVRESIMSGTDYWYDKVPSEIRKWFDND